MPMLLVGQMLAKSTLGAQHDVCEHEQMQALICWISFELEVVAVTVVVVVAVAVEVEVAVVDGVGAEDDDDNVTLIS